MTTVVKNIDDYIGQAADVMAGVDNLQKVLTGLIEHRPMLSSNDFSVHSTDQTKSISVDISHAYRACKITVSRSGDVEVRLIISGTLMGTCKYHVDDNFGGLPNPFLVRCIDTLFAKFPNDKL